MNARRKSSLSLAVPQENGGEYTWSVSFALLYTDRHSFPLSLSLSLPCAAMFVFIESLKRDFRVHALSKIKKAKLVRVRARVFHALLSSVFFFFCLLKLNKIFFFFVLNENTRDRTGSGTFCEGDFSIGKLGVKISESELSKLDEDEQVQIISYARDEGDACFSAAAAPAIGENGTSESVEGDIAAVEKRMNDLFVLNGSRGDDDGGRGEANVRESGIVAREEEGEEERGGDETTTTTTTTTTRKSSARTTTTDDDDYDDDYDESSNNDDEDDYTATNKSSSNNNSSRIDQSFSSNSSTQKIEQRKQSQSNKEGERRNSMNNSRSNSSLTNTTTSETGTPKFSSFLSTLDDLDFSNARLLGSGASGVVQSALHKPTKKNVAVKSFRVNLDDDRRKAMITELRTLHESKCPYVVNCYGAFFADGATIRVVLELMDGGSLDNVCKRNKNLPWKEEDIASVASQSCLGLKYLHDTLRVVHRDVKPSNILCCLQTGMVKLSDFGVSGRLGESGAECTSWVGTATYMSPERIKGDGYDYKTDCWSLALTLLEFAFGKFPYAVVSANEQSSSGGGGLEKQKSGGSYGGFWDIMDLIVHGPSPESELSEDIHGVFSDSFRAFIRGGLKKDACERSSSSEMSQHEFVNERDPEADARTFAAFLKKVFDEK